MKPCCLLPSPCGSLWRETPYPLCSHPLKYAESLYLLIAFCWENAKKGWMKKERRWHRFSTDKISTIMRLSGRPERRTLLLWGGIYAFSSWSHSMFNGLRALLQCVELIDFFLFLINKSPVSNRNYTMYVSKGESNIASAPHGEELMLFWLEEFLDIHS